MQSVPPIETPGTQASELDRAFAGTPSLFEVLRTVRSRRIGLGYHIDAGTTEAHPVTGRDVTVPLGPRSFVSKAGVVPLTETEEALIAWAACGPNGRSAWDRSHVPGFDEATAQTGHTVPHAGSAPAASLVVINDGGVVVYRPVTDAANVVEMAGPNGDRYQPILGWYRSGTRRVRDSRPDIDHALCFSPGPGNPVMGTYQHNINRPGSTWYLPVTDCGQLGATLLPSFGTLRAYPVDEFNGGRPCGVDELVSAGTLLHPVPISQLELSVFQAEQFPVGCIVQNTRLAAEALGLGHWSICGYSQEALFGAMPALTTGLGFHAEPPNARAPVATGALKVFGIRDVIEATYVPSPRYPTAESLVDTWRQARLGGALAEQHDPASEPWVRDACIRYITYCVETFGQWPMTYNPMQARISVIVHHIDPEFYDAYYPPGYVTARHREHMTAWH